MCLQRLVWSASLALVVAVHEDHLHEPTIESFDHYDKNIDNLLDKEEFFRLVLEHESRKQNYHASPASSRLDAHLDRFWKNDYQSCTFPSALIFRPMPGRHLLDSPAAVGTAVEEWIINDAQAHQISGVSLSESESYMIEGHYERTDPRLFGKITITKSTEKQAPMDTSAFRFYRVFVKKQKNDDSEAVQMSNFKFYSGPLCEEEQTPIAVTNYGFESDQFEEHGNSGTRTFESEKFASYHEGPGNLADGEPLTKWLDFNKKPVIFEFKAGTPAIRCYTWATANDFEERDPIAWTVEAAAGLKTYGDGTYEAQNENGETVDFEIVDERPIATDAPITFHRNTFLAKMPFTTIYDSGNYDGRFTDQKTFVVDGSISLQEHPWNEDIAQSEAGDDYTVEVTNSSLQHILINDRMVLNGSEADWAPCLSSVFTSTEKHQIVHGDPILGTEDFVNAAEIEGNVVFVERGNTSFMVKAQHAQKAGASALIIGNTEPSEKLGCALLGMEVEAGFRVDIPVVLLTHEESRSIAASNPSTFAMPGMEDQWYSFDLDEILPVGTAVRTADGKERGVTTATIVHWSFGSGYVVKMYKDGAELLYSDEYAGIVGNLRNILTKDLERKRPDATLLAKLGEQNKLDFLNFSHSTFGNTHKAELTSNNFDRSVGIEVMFEGADTNADGKLSKEEACTILYDHE